MLFIYLVWFIEGKTKLDFNLKTKPVRVIHNTHPKKSERNPGWIFTTRNIYSVISGFVKSGWRYVSFVLCNCMVENSLIMTFVNVLLGHDNTKFHDFASWKGQFFSLTGFIVLLFDICQVFPCFAEIACKSWKCLLNPAYNVSSVIIWKSFQCPLTEPYWQSDFSGGSLNVFSGSLASFLRCFHVIERDFLKCPKLKSPSQLLNNKLVKMLKSGNSRQEDTNRIV